MRRACWLAGLLVVSLSGCGRPPAMDHLKPSVFAPKELYPGGTGVLQVLIANDGDEPLQISDIDLEKTLLAGAEVIDVKPRPNGPVLELRSYRVYRMQLDVAGQSMQTVEFTLRAGDRPGTWTGDVDVGLDNFHTVTAPATLVVLPFHGQAVAPAPAPAVVAPATSSLPAAPPAAAPAAGYAAPAAPPVTAAPPAPVSTPNPLAPPAAPSGHAAGSQPAGTLPTAGYPVPPR